MKKRLLLFVTMFMFLVGCEPDIVSIEVYSYPDKIAYFMGIDTELDLTGLEIMYNYERGDSEVYNVLGYNLLEKDYSLKVVSDVDFNTPGVYTVTLDKGKMSCTFPIQVIDISDYIIDD